MQKPNRKRLEKVKTFIEDYHLQFGYSPSYREIGKGCELSSLSRVWYYIRLLEHEGYLLPSSQGHWLGDKTRLGRGTKHRGLKPTSITSRLVASRDFLDEKKP